MKKFCGHIRCPNGAGYFHRVENIIETQTFEYVKEGSKFFEGPVRILIAIQGDNFFRFVSKELITSQFNSRIHIKSSIGSPRDRGNPSLRKRILYLNGDKWIQDSEASFFCVTRVYPPNRNQYVRNYLVRTKYL